MAPLQRTGNHLLSMERGGGEVRGFWWCRDKYHVIQPWGWITSLWSPHSPWKPCAPPPRKFFDIPRAKMADSSLNAIGEWYPSHKHTREHCIPFTDKSHWMTSRALFWISLIPHGQISFFFYSGLDNLEQHRVIWDNNGVLWLTLTLVTKCTKPEYLATVMGEI